MSRITWPFCAKPLEIQTKWPPFCSDFQWFGFGMVGNIAIALADHSIGNPNFKQFSIPICSVFQCSVFKPPLYWTKKSGFWMNLDSVPTEMCKFYILYSKMFEWMDTFWTLTNNLQNCYLNVFFCCFPRGMSGITFNFFLPDFHWS